ncbi:MAG: flagellar export chaperone FliS [Polyangiales bacterium]
MNTSAATALSKYGAVAVTTCSPGQLLVMLYDGLFRFLAEAKAAMERGDRKRAGERLSRSHAILEQLLAALDPTHNPSLCEQLMPLYRWCMSHLVEANAMQRTDSIDEVLRVLNPLRDAWKTAVAQVAADRPPDKPSVARR